MKNVIKFLFLLSIVPSLFNAKENTQQTSKGYVLNSQSSVPSKYGRIHTDKQINFADKTSTNSTKKLRQASLPSSYSSVEAGYITSVKNQNPYGTCWAFAASAASEASLIKNNGFDKNSINLSELHLAYFTYNNSYDELGLLSGDSFTITSDSYLEYGGINYNSMLSYARWTGPADEGKNTKYSYSNANKSFKATSTSDAYSLTEAHLKNCYIIDTSDISLMKQMILEYGAGDFGYYHDENDRYFNDTYDSYCYVQSVNTSSNRFNWANHEVTVVGWDDNFSRTKFSSNSRPTNNGAWLVKNSWGSGWGDNGYFWLSYEDSSTIAEPTAFYSFDSKDHYEKNYQYDGTSDFYAEYSDNEDQGGYTGGGYMANVFTAQENENVGAVTFVSFDENIKYEISVYDNVNNTPTSGKLVSQKSGVETYAGFHTIELDTIPTINKGNKFAVVVRLTSSSNASDSITLACDESYNDTQNGIKTVNSASSGQSYFSTNGTSWTDVSANKKINFRVKALTTGEIVDLENISFDKSSISLAYGDTYTLTPTFTPSNASNKNLIWSSSDTNVATVSDGIVTALNKGTTVITATSKENNSIKATIAVNVKGINSISISGTANKNIYNQGDTFNPAGLEVTATYTDGTTGIIDNNKCDWLDSNTSSEHLSIGTTSVICKIGSASATYSGITVNEVKTYQLVKDISSLNVGDKVVIAQNSKGVVASNLNSTYLNASNTSFSNNKNEITTLPSDASIYTIGKNGNYYTFTNSNNQKLGSTGAKNLSFNSGSTNWSISISDNLANIQNATSSYGRILYNSPNTRFTTYTSNTNTSMLLPQLYRLPTGNTVVSDMSVSVDKTTLDINESTSLKVTFTPANALNKNVSVTSSNDNIVTIDGLKVTGKNRGETTLTITSIANPSISKQINIKVYSSTLANEVKQAIENAKNEFSVTRENVRDLSNINAKIENAKTLSLSLFDEEKALINNEINTLSSLESAYNYLNDLWYKEENMDTNSISKENAQELVNAYNNLDESTKTILKAAYCAKNNSEESPNIEDTINNISKQFTNNNNNSNSTLIIVLVSIGAIVVIAGAVVILLKKKKHIA